MIRLSSQDDIESARRAQKVRILDSFHQATPNPKTALAITKAEFDEKYPEAEWERYSLANLHKFRQDIQKAEDIENKDEIFKSMTADLRPFIVHNEGKKVIVFTRKKEAGEK